MLSMPLRWVSLYYIILECKYMAVSRRMNPSSPTRLFFGNSNLEIVKCFKYLGLLLSCNLFFPSILYQKKDSWAHLLS